MKNFKRFFTFCLALLLVLTACSDAPDEGGTTSGSSKSFDTEKGRGDPLTILSGSENKVLEPLIEDFAESSGHKVHIDYLGSLDIMRQLESGEIDYDAVWPASSLWLNMGDTHHLLKHNKTIAISPVIFGIRKPLAEELGFTNRTDVTMAEISQAIASGKLRFAMTSATQSNSGASAYLAFLTALSQNPGQGLTQEDLQDPRLQKEIQNLLSGVNRSSGSSNWLVDLFLMGDYDAMVNYEQLILQTNQELVKDKRDPLYAVYPTDGLSLSDSPLAYVDRGDQKKEEIFLAFQDYLLSDQGQKFIESTGKRSAFGQVREENRALYKEEWGIQLDRTLSPIRFPQTEVITEALNLYQSSFKKPAYTVYVLDYSGSMAGSGNEEMLSALEQIWLPEKAKANFLQGNDRDVTLFLPFSSGVIDTQKVEGADLSRLQILAEDTPVNGGTALFEAADQAMKELSQVPNLMDQYSPGIVLLTDGHANGRMDFTHFSRKYEKYQLDIPIFSIQFGDADSEDLEKLAKLSHARVFDGRGDLTEAFRNVKGYN